MSAEVMLLTTGGTIEAVGDGPLDLDGYMFTGMRVPAEQLLADVRDALPDVSIAFAPLATIPSPDVTSEHWLALRDAIVGRGSEAASFVVTHGTNTLEETALFLDLTLSAPATVVLTGAMRPAGAIGADGPANLVAAVRVAREPASRGRGVLVVLGGTVHAASRVTKHASDTIESFSSPGTGPVARVGLDGRVRFHAPPAGRDTVELPEGLTRLPRVDVVVAHSESDGAHAVASVEHGARGIVLAGTGGGFPSEQQRSALEAAREQGVWVCRAGRGAAATADANRAFPGWLAAGTMRPWQARVVLAVCLAGGVAPERCQALLDRHGS
jgi:L-asparaginase